MDESLKEADGTRGVMVPSESEMERMRRLLEIGEDPLAIVRRHEALMGRFLRPDSTTRLLASLEQPSYVTRLAEQFEALNRRSPLFDATQSLLARPTMLERLEELTESSAKIQRFVDHALLPDRHSLTVMAEAMAKHVLITYGVPWKGTVPQRVRIPPGKLSLQPVAIGADDGGNDIVRSTSVERVA